mmetsp:Transcript_60870/g.142416  ORF Transcript_60870/g.142416 Transcript_60870/m.142416 type:complete len:122 (+) Transcript_60870:90-455(+)
MDTPAHNAAPTAQEVHLSACAAREECLCSRQNLFATQLLVDLPSLAVPSFGIGCRWHHWLPLTCDAINGGMDFDLARGLEMDWPGPSALAWSSQKGLLQVSFLQHVRHLWHPLTSPQQAEQ